MPVIQKYAQQLQSMLGSGGAITVDARITIQQAIKILNDFRAVAISEYYRAKGSMPEQVYQTSSLIYVPEIQDKYDLERCIYSYPCERILPPSPMNDGISFVGVQNGENTPRVRSRAQMANHKKHYLINGMISESAWALYEPEYSSILFHKPFGGATKRLIIRAIFASPERLPEYSLEHDDFPITDELFNIVLGLVQEKYFRPIMTSPPDVIPNASEDSSLSPQISQNNNG